MGLKPVPANGEDLIRGADAGGFVFTEAQHGPDLHIPLHAHERATLTVLLEGVFEETYPGGRVEACAAPAVLFRPPEENHTDRVGRTGARNMVIELPAERLRPLCEAVPILGSVATWSGARFGDLGRRIQRELASSDQAASLALEALALELIATALRSTGFSRQTGPFPRWLRQVRDLLHDRFAEQGLRMADLATEVGVHPVYLARAFRERYGSSPGEYVRRLRLEWAAQELLRSGRPLAEIALAAGFADQSHFTRAFRSAFGVTPGQFRAPGPGTRDPVS